MLIFQKNFNITVPFVQNPELRNRVQLPEVDGIVPAWQQPIHSVKSTDSNRPDSINSSFRPNDLGVGVVSDPVKAAIDKVRAEETDKILREDAINYAREKSNDLASEDLQKIDNKNRSSVDKSKDLVEIQDVDTIDTTVEKEDPLPERKPEEIRAIKTQVIKDNVKNQLNKAKDSVKETSERVKTKALETYGNLADKYGEGVTGSLAGDAALAAGGLALAGGAYHLIKKRNEKKKAEKEALKNRIKE